MKESAARFNLSRRGMGPFRKIIPSQEALFDSYSDEIGLAPRCRSAEVLESYPSPKLRLLEVISDKEDRDLAARLLFIGDNFTLIPEQLKRAFPAPRHRVLVTRTGAIGLEFIDTGSADVIVLDLSLADKSGREIYRQIRAIDSRIPIIVLAGSKYPNAAIEYMKQGAFDCLFKPFDPVLLQQVVGKALAVAQHMRQPPPGAQSETEPDLEGGIVGSCPAMGEVYKAIGRVADQSFPVLITGESGTGKELVARAIYQHSSRADAPFLALNCAAIPEHLLESELFGHEKGAFTGADRRRIGKFEQCNGGTLFLDEIGDMPPALQTKILRLVQEQSFERVGGNETIRTDVRLIAATHRNLKVWSAEGKFRPDLYYRLGVFNIHLPPLRERGADLTLLVQHYLKRYSRELGREICQVDPEAAARLKNYGWPGNIRELQSVLKQSLLQAKGSVLLSSFLPVLEMEFGEPTPKPIAMSQPGMESFVLHQRLDSDARDLYAETHRQIDRLLISRVMEYTKGNLQQSARLLGIARQTLRLKLRDLGLSSSRLTEVHEDLPMVKLSDSEK